MPDEPRQVRILRVVNGKLELVHVSQDVGIVNSAGGGIWRGIQFAVRISAKPKEEGEADRPRHSLPES